VQEINHIKKELTADHEMEYLAQKDEYEALEQQRQEAAARAKHEHVEDITEMRRSQEAETIRFKEAHWQIVTDLQEHHQSAINRIRSEHTLATTNLKQTHQVEMSHSKAAYLLLSRELNDAVAYQHEVSSGLQEGLDVFRASLNTIFSHQPRFDRSEGKPNSKIDLDWD
jgi:hypothetical protein